MNFSITKSYPKGSNTEAGRKFVRIEIDSPNQLPDKFFDDVARIVSAYNRGAGKETAERIESFNKFYNMYGRKEKKEPTRKAWLKLTDEEIKAIFATLPAFLKATPDVRYRPMALTYLNQRRWEDEISPAVVAPSKPAWAQPATFNA